MPETLWPLRFFDPKTPFAIVERELPHWAQAGSLCFLTWRTHDSMPRSVLEAWYAERHAWLRKHGIAPDSPDWRLRLHALGGDSEVEFLRAFSDRWQEHLDDCHGACVLERPDLAAIVAEALKRFDGDRYDLTDFVVMPNHVHVLVAFPGEPAMLAHCESWKRFSATKINRLLGRRGRFWQQDGFDHLVRSAEQFEYLRGYIAANPRKAGLPPGVGVHFSKPFEVLSVT